MLTQAQTHTILAISSPHVYTPQVHTRAHTLTCTQISESAHRTRAHTHLLLSRVPTSPYAHTFTRAHTQAQNTSQCSRSPQALTVFLSASLAGRSFLRRLTAFVFMGPRSRGRGGGGGEVPFPKRGAGARSAAAPGGAWARGTAPPARSACARTSAALRPRVPARAPRAGGGS